MVKCLSCEGSLKLPVARQAKEQKTKCPTPKVSTQKADTGKFSFLEKKNSSSQLSSRAISNSSSLFLLAERSAVHSTKFPSLLDLESQMKSQKRNKTKKKT